VEGQLQAADSAAVVGGAAGAADAAEPRGLISR